MPRATNAVASRKRRKKVLRQAKGYVGGRSRLYRTAAESIKRAMAYSTRDRKVKKRNFRNLWITRLNAACRQNGISYSKFIAGLKKAKVEIDRKVLAEVAYSDEKAFKALVDLVKAA